MKSLEPALAAHLASGATTLCWCWRLSRRDGVVLGFTDHDRDIEFDGTTYEASAGFTASEMREQVGLSVDNLEVTGALSSAHLEEQELASGLYDEARVEIFRVNWQDTSQRLLMRWGSLGEVTRAGLAFSAEVRGISHYLQQPNGRLFQFTCDADLGDGRCSIDLTNPLYRGAGIVTEAEGARRFTASGLESFSSGWFTRGLLRFTSGDAGGQRIEVKRHVATGARITFELWQPVHGSLSPGQSFEVTAGCDKLISTCRNRFSNAVNFRGFPHMPGNDFIARIARPGRSTA